MKTVPKTVRENARKLITRKLLKLKVIRSIQCEVKVLRRIAKTLLVNILSNSTIKNLNPFKLNQLNFLNFVSEFELMVSISNP